MQKKFWKNVSKIGITVATIILKNFWGNKLKNRIGENLEFNNITALIHWNFLIPIFYSSWMLISSKTDILATSGKKKKRLKHV